MTDISSRRGGLIAGWLFAVPFFVGLFMVGDQAGAFADSERAYADIFADTSHRVQDLVGSVLLMVSSIAFAGFAHFIAPAQPGGSRYSWSIVVRVGGSLSAAAILVAGATFATVPASLAMGDFFDDPGIVTAQNVLPSLGYILLVGAAMIPAIAVMVGSTRIGAHPKWFVWLTLAMALLLVLTSSTVATMALLPIWVAVTAVVQSRRRQTPHGDA